MLARKSKQVGLYHSGVNGLTKSVRPFHYFHWFPSKSTLKLNNTDFFYACVTLGHHEKRFSLFIFHFVSFRFANYSKPSVMLGAYAFSKSLVKSKTPYPSFIIDQTVLFPFVLSFFFLSLYADTCLNLYGGLKLALF